LRLNEERLPRIILEAEELSKQLEVLKDSLPQLTSRTQIRDENDDKVNELKNLIKERERELEESIQKAQSIKDSIAKLQEEILSVGGDELKSQRKIVDEISTKLEKCNSEIVTLETNNKSYKRSITKCENNIESATKEREEIDLDLEKKSEKLNELLKSEEEIRNENEKKLSEYEEKKKEVNIQKKRIGKK